MNEQNSRDITQENNESQKEIKDPQNHLTLNMKPFNESIQQILEPIHQFQEMTNAFKMSIPSVERFIAQTREINERIAELQKIISPQLLQFTLHFQERLVPRLTELFKEIGIQKAFIDECTANGWVPSPVLYEFFGNKFSSLPQSDQEQLLKQRWTEFRKTLWGRRPQNFMSPYKELMLQQMLNSHEAEGYIPVCRAVYPEIENLAREYIYLDTELVSSLKKEKSGRRVKLLSQKINEVFKDDETPLDDFYILELGGLLAYETLQVIRIETRAEYTPLEETGKDLSKNRHFHAHGGQLVASCKDSINALLLLDMAMQIFARLHESYSTENNKKNKPDAD